MDEQTSQENTTIETLDSIAQEPLADIANAALCSAAINANFAENTTPVQPMTGDYYRQKSAKVMSWQDRIKAITRECWTRGFGKF